MKGSFYRYVGDSTDFMPDSITTQLSALLVPEIRYCYSRLSGIPNRCLDTLSL